MKIYHSLSELYDAKEKFPSYVTSSDGNLYLVKQSKLGTMIAKATHIPNLAPVEDGFKFNLPAIPIILLSQIYSFFRDICEKYDVEVFLQIFYDTEEERYFLECPKQIVSKGRVQAELNPKYLGINSMRYIQVAQFHSHNSMSAYFSSVDDADETAYMIYGVWGLLNTDKPNLKMRVRHNCDQISINPWEIFDGKSIQYVDYPSEWNWKIYQKK